MQASCRTTSPGFRHDGLSIPLRSALAETLEWALRLGGWLAFGTLGRTVFPLWAGGFGLLVAWLAILGAASLVPCGSTATRPRVRGVLIVAGLACGLAGLGNLRSGAGPACLLAAGWAVALVAAGRVTAAFHTGARRPCSRLAPAVIGTGLALAVAGDPATLAAVAWWAVPAAALVLGAVARSGTADPCHRPDSLHCVWPFGTGSMSLAPAAWPAHCACLGMLPMMATLADTGGLCGGAFGFGLAEAVTVHLAAMRLPALVRSFAGRAIDGPSFVASAMLLGPLLLWALPGARGLTALSLCQALAWGFATNGRFSPAASDRRMRAMPWPATLLPAVGVWAVGAAVLERGPAAIASVQVLLGAIATLGAATSFWCTPRASPTAPSVTPMPMA